MNYSIFTKPWKALSIEALGAMVADMGFDAIEFPLRDGYQVSPTDAVRGLPDMARRLSTFGVRIGSVASGLSEEIFQACAEVGVPYIRIMANFPLSDGDYFAAERKAQETVARALPYCAKYGVKIAVQQHYGTGIFNSMELLHFLEPLDARYVFAIWDAAHSALAGEEPAQGLSILRSRLGFVNFKNAYQSRSATSPLETAEYHPCFCQGPFGKGDWAAAIRYLHDIGYDGLLCMPAEYTDETQVEEYIRQDLAYLRRLVKECYT